MNLILLNYEKVKCDTGIPLEEIKEIIITVLTGDETATVIKKTGEELDFDTADLAGNGRLHDYYDGTYTVDMDNLERWVNRKHSYDRTWEEQE